ncbi:MAG: GspH/FimT family pseudopilin [Fimbriimonadaceae bacterium]|nr:GspH/FimT family pseudopilin [Fimbriimonadaceae bacterium]
MTTSRRPRTSNGFTLIEMMVVLTLLVFMAAMVYPNLARLRDAQEKRDFVSGLATFARQAREEAISGGQSVRMRLGDGDNSLEIVTTDVDSGDERTLRTRRFPDGFSTGQTRIEDAIAPGSEWQLTFYPDGSSDRGGIEITEGQRVYALVLDNEIGQPRLIDGNLPDLSQDRWAAGEFERRG